MNRQPVDSTNIASVGWEPSDADASVGTLAVEFNSGHIYAYDDVPEETYLNLLGASSVGRFFNQNVKGAYTERRVS